MDEATKNEIRKMFTKSLETEARQSKEKSALAEAQKKFYEQFEKLANEKIRPDFQQTAELFLEQNYPAAVYEAEREISLQVATRGAGLEAVNKRNALGVALKFWANHQDNGFVVVSMTGFPNGIDEKWGMAEIITKLQPLLRVFVGRALEQLRQT